MRCVLIVGDGMADLPIERLGYRTPLEAADPAHFHGIASRGVSGLLDPVAPGIAAGSDIAHLTILGQDPAASYTGRGPLEAAGAGIDLRHGELAFRCNLARVDGTGTVIDPRVSISETDGEAVECAIDGMRLRGARGVKLCFWHTGGFKGILILRGVDQSCKSWGQMPRAGAVLCSLSRVEREREAAGVLDEFVRGAKDTLSGLGLKGVDPDGGECRCNAIIPWGGGSAAALKQFSSIFGLRGACVSGTALIKGICRLSGFKVCNVEGATGDLNTDVQAKAEAALRAIGGHDFVLVHVQGADEASHDGNVDGKVSIIKRMNGMVGAIRGGLDGGDSCLMIIADHTTSTECREHTADPVPLSIEAPNLIRDGVDRYSEREVMKGALGRVSGRLVMPIFTELAKGGCLGGGELYQRIMNGETRLIRGPRLRL